MPDSLQQQDQSPQQPKLLTWPYTKTPIPQPLQGIFSAVGTRWDGLGKYLRGHLPGVVVNHSSNIVGAIQLLGEAMYYKSTGNYFLDPEYHGATRIKTPNILDYIIQPPKNIIKATLGKFKNNGHKFEPFKLETYTEAVRGFFDLKRAAHLNSAGGTMPLTNNVGALAGLVGMSSMALATFLPDNKETDAQIEENATLAHNNPVAYVGKRLLQAVNPIDWWNNKRHLVGVGMMATGLFSFMAGFRVPFGKFGHEAQVYKRNLGQMAGGLITATAGTQLLLAGTNQQGWTNYGTTQMSRIFTIIPNVYGRLKPSADGKRDMNAAWYVGAQGLFFTKNTTASLIGGAEQHGGKVVSHDMAEKGQSRPTTTVGDVTQREAAMPERVDAQKQAEASATA